ncbi:DUF1697 domain-containing protein [Zhihengliuella salsuginis]|nr:DUF1697 domain-containing protein [Zhihengliuella salsuginis]
MSDYAAFLRGINVSGRRIPMADLAECVAGAGVRDVRTVLATGNILFAADAPREEVASRLASAIGGRFGFEARLFLKTLPEVAEIVAACPFARTDTHDGAALHTYVTFASSAQTVADVLAELGPAERAAGHGDVLFWQTPKGSSLENPVAKALGRARFKESSTTRNINTLDKVLAR